jgi:hypothetical protein
MRAVSIDSTRTVPKTWIGVRLERICPLLTVLFIAPCCLVRTNERSGALLKRDGFRRRSQRSLPFLVAGLEWIYSSRNQPAKACRLLTGFGEGLIVG